MADTKQAASASPMPPGVTDPGYTPSPGRLGNLTVPEQHALDKLKKELKEEGHFVEERMDDATLLRFLRARKFDVGRAKEMILSAEQWRKDFGVEDIIKEFNFKERAEVNKYYPQYYHKTDKEGRPIYIERLNTLDKTRLYQVTTKERLLQRLVLEYEKFITDRLPACSKAVGHPVETSCTILDIQNIGIGEFYAVKDYIMAASSIGQDRYPECMGKFYIINAPWLFGSVWAVIRTFLDKVTQDKIQIFSDGGKKPLLEAICEENLPAELGGKCNCVGGCSLSDAGPWNPEGPKNPENPNIEPKIEESS